MPYFSFLIINLYNRLLLYLVLLIPVKTIIVKKLPIKLQISGFFYKITSFYPAMPGDSNDFIPRIIIPALPRFYHFFVFV